MDSFSSSEFVTIGQTSVNVFPKVLNKDDSKFKITKILHTDYSGIKPRVQLTKDKITAARPVPQKSILPLNISEKMYKLFLKNRNAKNYIYYRKFIGLCLKEITSPVKKYKRYDFDNLVDRYLVEFFSIEIRKIKGRKAIFLKKS